MMRAPLLIAPPLLIAMSFGGTATPDRRSELLAEGRIDSMEVNTAGEIWFGTALGKVYLSRDWNRTWTEAAVPVRSDPTGISIFSDNISQVRFFDARRGIVVGYLGDAHNVIYRTADGGATWTTVNLPSSLWVYEARTTKEGLGWLVGSSGELLFSADFGATWSSLTAPFDQVSRSYSVDFASRSLGVIGSLHGALKITRDGGRSWRSIKSPSESRLIKCGETRVSARLLGNLIVVAQCDATFYRPISMKAPWSELRVGSNRVVDFEPTGQGLTAVTSDLAVVRCSDDLSRCAPTGFRLTASPVDIASGAGKVVFLDTTSKVSVLDGETFESSRMFRSGKGPDPILARDRESEASLWGISSYFLYHTDDAGEMWERVTELPSRVNGVAIQASGDVLIWSRHGYVTRWNRRAGRLESVPGLDGLDIVGLFRRKDLWLVYGGLQHQTTQRIEVARTYFSGQFAGSADHGFVAASTDGGQTWRVVDEWKDGGVQQIFLGDDGTLTLLSWLCAVRRGRLELDATGGPTASLQTILPATEKNRQSVPYVEEAHLLDFLSGPVGWVRGWTHHRGDFLFRSDDGGRTWQPADPATRRVDRLHRLGNGTWLGLTPPGEISRWTGDRFVPLRKFEREITSSLVDATGRLLLQLDGGELWSYDQDTGEWRRLSPASGS